jgi:hypothetical protein
VKRSRRAQTVLGDRHDLIYEILLQVQSAACGTRPAEFFNGWARKQMRGRIEPLKWATRVVFRHCLPISSRRACESQSAACGTRPAEFFNGWARKQMRDGSEKRSSENLIRQRGQRNDLNPGEFASRASLRSSAQHV